jgi:hypothetical protein
MPSTTVLILSQNFFRSACRLMRGDSLFTLTVQHPRPPENAELFAKKIGSASPHTHHTHPISHRPTSFYSDISDIVCMESFFHHVKNYLQEFMKSSGSSDDQPWKSCFGTEWRHSNEFLRIAVATIHKLNTD